MKKNATKQPVIFLDRDGTLIEEVNFLSRVEELRLFPFSKASVTTLKEAGFLVIVVTNQSGIARGIYGEADMHAIHDQIQHQLDGTIDAFYFCPHLPTEGCSCRKPGLGMFENAARDFAIDLSRSWMIGDKKIDVEAGQNARVSTAMVLTGYGELHKHTLEAEPTVIAADFGAATAHIVRLAAEVVL